MNRTCIAAIAKEERPDEELSRVPTGWTTSPKQATVQARLMEEEIEPVEPLEESNFVGEDHVFDQVEELKGITMMRTSEPHKSSTSIFLLHSYQRHHLAPTLAFAHEVKNIFEKPSPWRWTSDASLLYPLLPRYSEAKLLEPFIWNK